MPQALKKFSKEIGASEAFFLDSSGEKTSQEVKVLEEGNPWSNWAELYIGLIKESVREAEST